MISLSEAKRHLIDHWRLGGAREDLLRAFEKVPREQFVPQAMHAQAYADRPLHIGGGQTISQPSTVLNMLTLLDPAPGMQVLEVGAGSGYVCALLAALGCTVTGVEFFPELVARASRSLREVSLSERVRLYAADGGGGWDEHAPYDRILLSAAAPEVPRHLLSQLKEDGVLVAPVGLTEQRMIVCRKGKGDAVSEEDHGAYVFVPLLGRFGVQERGRVE